VVQIGYTIAPAFQGHGYATEAVGALVAYVLETLGADVVRAYANSENVPSIRVAEKVGMRLVELIERTRTRSVVRYEVGRASSPGRSG